MVSHKPVWTAILVLVVIFAGVYYLIPDSPTNAASFKGHRISGQVPLNVIFSYDISGVKADSVILDFGAEGKKMLLPKNQKTVTMSYLIPGLYRVLLRADDKIIGKETVHAQSAGWSGIIYTETDYYFLQDNSFIKNGVMGYLPEDKGIGESKLYQPINKNGVVEFNNFKDFGVDGENFVLETRLRVAVPDSGQYCYKAYIRVKEANITRCGRPL